MNTNLVKQVRGRSSRELKGKAAIKNLTGLKVRLFREKRGWTQHQLAESLHKMGVPISRDVIANIETQRCPVTDWQIVFFARLLGISWKSLFPTKDVLESFAPPDAPQIAPKGRSNRSTKKRFTENSNPRASQKGWKVCEMTCKSVKITLRGPP